MSRHLFVIFLEVLITKFDIISQTKNRLLQTCYSFIFDFYCDSYVHGVDN